MRCQLQEARGLCFENLVVLASFDTTLLHSPFISFILITIIVGPVRVHSTNTTTAISSHNSHNSCNNISTKSPWTDVTHAQIVAPGYIVELKNQNIWPATKTNWKPPMWPLNALVYLHVANLPGSSTFCEKTRRTKTKQKALLNGDTCKKNAALGWSRVLRARLSR